MTPAPGLGEKKPVLAVLGATASGKTALALSLAERFACEIVNCDSRQIYDEMRIGTASPTDEELSRAPHHLFNFLCPSQTFSAADYVARAAASIKKIWAGGRVPLLTGGTGFYYAALAEGLGEAGHNAKRAIELRELAEKNGHASMVALLLKLDPAAGATVDLLNPRRVLRAIEIVETTGQPFAANCPKPPLAEAEFLPVVVTRPRPFLHAAIERRVDQMIVAGLESEVRHLSEKYGRTAGGLNSIGYHEWLAHFAGDCSAAAVRELIIIHTRQYARRQEIWFRRRPGVPLADPGEPEQFSAIFLKVAAFLSKFGL